MSKARAKGTEFENHIMYGYLQEIWPEVERAPLKGINDFGDFVNVAGWLIEARNRKTWALPAWIRGVYSKLEREGRNRYGKWMLVFKADKRTDLNGDYVLMSASQAFSLIETETLYWAMIGRLDEHPLPRH